MEWATWLLSGSLFLVTYYWMSRPPWKLPPGPPRLPLLGTLPFMLGDLKLVWSRLAKKYGDIYTVYMGTERVVILNGYETIKTCLTKTGGVFDGRPWKIWKDFTKLQGVISSDGELWKEHRRYVLHLLRDFGLGKRSMEDLITEEVSHIVDEIRSRDHIITHLQQLMEKSTFNVIGWTAFGCRYDYDEAKLKEAMTHMNGVMRYAGPDNMSLVFDLLRYIPGDPFNYYTALGSRRKMDAVFEGWIEEHKQSLAEDKPQTDVIGMYLQEAQKRRDDPNNTFTDSQLLQIVGDLFFAGTDTTATTLAWAFLYMLRHPEIQAKVQEEIDSVTGGNRAPTTSDRPHMPYTEAVLSEVGRVADILPLSVPHAMRVDTEIEGYTIPAGTMVLVNITSILHDPHIWPKPLEFDPERFLDDDGKYKKIAQFTPFSMGKRVCMGEGLARMELFIVFTHLLQQFTFQPVDGHGPPSTEYTTGIVYSPLPYDVKFIPRQLDN